MKNSIIKTLLLSFILLPLGEIYGKGFEPQPEQDRNVIWLHGLDGDEDALKYYEDIFTAERKMTGIRESYNSSTTLDAASYEVMSKVDNTLGNQSTHHRNMAIGHSMGGMVSRNVDKITDGVNRRFGGLITMASPNNGAYIANSLLNGSVDAFVADAAAQLWAGPQAQGFGVNFIFPNPISFLSSALSPQILADIVVEFLDIQNMYGNNQINSQLKVGSPVINNLNNYESGIPRISMTAVESSPVHWRLVGSTLNWNEGNLPEHEEFVEKMNMARQFYHAQYSHFTGLSIATGIFGLFTPGNYFLAAAYALIANQYKKGRNWLDLSENKWISLIGSYFIEEYTYIIQVLICDEPETELDWGYPGDDHFGGNNCHWVDYEVTKEIMHMLPSDGLVSTTAQTIHDIPWNNVYTIHNANHTSMKNMSFMEGNDNVEEEFNNIFNRLPSTDFFNTKVR